MRRHKSPPASIILVEEQDIYSAIGEEGFVRLVAAFYKQIPQDDILGPMYAGRDLAAAERRLCDFLLFRFGGSTRYIEERGHPRLRLRHNPFPIDQAARDRWMQLMSSALRIAVLPGQAELLLKTFFEETSTFLINRQGTATLP